MTSPTATSPAALRIAILQVASPDEESIGDRRRRVSDLVRSTADADLIVLPELWAVGYFGFSRYAAAAEEADGETVRMLRGLARETGAHVHVGSFVERTPSGRLRNTAMLIAPNGDVVHRYSKIHVFGYRSAEQELLEPGSSLSTAITPFGAVSATTCYDLRFPGLWNTLGDIGAEIVIVPAAWPRARLGHWRLFTSVRAVEEQVFVVACNAAGVQDGVELGGASRVIDPWGECLAEAGAGEEVLRCEIDPGLVRSVRAEFPVLGDRIDSYQVEQPVATRGVRHNFERPEEARR